MVAVVAVIVALAVVFTALDGLAPRSAETIPVGTHVPSEQARAATVPAVDPANFETRSLPPVEVWTRRRTGTALLPDAAGLTIVATDHLGVWIADVPTGRVERLRLPQGGIPAATG